MSTPQQDFLRRLKLLIAGSPKSNSARERPRRQGALEQLENRSLMAADLANYAMLPQLDLNTQNVGTLQAGVEKVDQNMLPVFTLTAKNSAGTTALAAGATSSEFTAIQAKINSGKPDSSGQYALGSVKLGLFQLNNVTAKPEGSGIRLSAELTVPVFGKVKLSGVLSQDGTFTATMPDQPLLGGLAQVKNTTFTIKQNLAKIEADFSIPKLGVSSKLTGSIKSDGTYALEATAKFKVAGFEVNAGKFEIGDRIKVNFSIPIPALGGDVTFKGEYGSTGWAVEARVPVNIQIGPVTLKQIIVGVGQDQTGDILKLGAKGTIAQLSGFVDATAVAKIYTDGRINLDVTADALKIGGLNAGKVRVTVANDTPAGRNLYVATLQGEFQIPGLDSPLKLTGELRSDGYYRLAGQQDLQLGGLNLSQAKFEWIKGSPATFSALMDYSAIQVQVSGSIATNGRIQFQGTGAAKIGNGFNLANVEVSGDLNPAAKSYKLHIGGVVNALVGDVKITADVVGNGKTWPAPVLTGSAKIGGLLSSVFTGEAQFTIEQNRIVFAGKLGLNKVPGLTVGVTGSITADGKLSYDAKNSAGEVVTRLWREGVKEITQWLDKGKVVGETIVQDGVKIAERAWKDGVNTLNLIRDNAGKVVSHYWRDGAKEITQLYNNGKVVAETVVQNGIKLTERAWKDGVNTLNTVRDTAGKLVSQYWRDGAKEFQNLYTNGVRTAYAVWENGVNTARNTWNTAGQQLSAYWHDGAKQITQWYTNGKVTAENIYQNGVKVADRAWKDGVNTLNIVRDTAGKLVSEYWKDGNKTFQNLYTKGIRTTFSAWENGKNTANYVWSTSGQKISEYWRDGSKEFQNTYKNGKLVAQNIWNNGKNIAQNAWDSTGKYLGNALDKGANAAKKWWDSIF